MININNIIIIRNILLYNNLSIHYM